MDVIIDASSVINLDNGQALEMVSRLEDHRFWLSPLVIGECEPTCAATVLRLQQNGLLNFVDPKDVSAETYLEILETHDLGEGETECIAICSAKPFIFCCDDNKARQLAQRLLGNGSVIGSIGLLRRCVVHGQISAFDAYAIYELMRQAGGFLPDVDAKWFADGQV